jgi:hypothetical protein
MKIYKFIGHIKEIISGQNTINYGKMVFWHIFLFPEHSTQ